MKKLTVEIIKLEPMRMVSIYGYGEQPEDLSWLKVLEWIRETKFQFDPLKNRIFGFNNPSPSAGSVKYGYEFWISVGPDVELGRDARIVEFAGGLYAVAQMSIKNGEEIPPYWKALNIWCEESQYKFAQHQWLEEHSIEGVPFAIYMPIKE